MKKIDYNRWLNYTFSTGTHPSKDYLSFQNEMKNDLKKIAEQNNMILYSFNKNHYTFSAVLKDKVEEKFIYVSIEDVRGYRNKWFTNVLVRTMEHETDWTGGRNHFCSWDHIGQQARTLMNSMKMRDRDYDLELER